MSWVVRLSVLVAWAVSSSVASAAQIAIIIDDLGDNRVQGERFVALPGPVTGAFLPSSPLTERLALASHAAGKEVIVHLPMEATRRAVTHPDAIALSDDAASLRAIVQNGLDRVPHAVGLNNHQGSALTQNAEHMQWLMQALADNGSVYFVDSMTSGRSVGLRTARSSGIPATRRDVFLDNVRTPAAIDKQFKRLLRLARSRGSAIGIGHPYPETMDYLEAALPGLSAQGVELVPVSALISQPASTTRVAQAVVAPATASAPSGRAGSQPDSEELQAALVQAKTRLAD